MLSPSDSSALDSPQVIVFDGPWQSWMIVTWHASMLGRYFSSHSGVRLFMPAVPHAPRSTEPSAFVLVTRADVSSSMSAAMRPAPMCAPKRSGAIDTDVAPSVPRVTRPALCTAMCAPATAISMSRAMTFVPLR